MDFLENLTPEMLLASVPLQAFAVWLIVEYLVKRNIKTLDENVQGIATNISSAIVGIIFAIAVTFIVVGLDSRSLVWAVLQGLLAGGGATIGNEAKENYKIFREARREGK